MASPPILKLKSTVVEKIFSVISMMSLIICSLYLIIEWRNIPQKMPAHYNLDGEVVRWGDKTELLVLPILSLVIWIGLTLFERYPHLYNFDAKKLTKDNVESSYKNARMCVNFLKNQAIIIFLFMTWNSIQVSKGYTNYMNYWSTVIMCIVIFGTVVLFILRGIRLQNGTTP